MALILICKLRTGVRIISCRSADLTCFRWHTSITVYLQRILDCSNSHERRDIAHKITFFQSPPPFYLSETFVVENIR